MKTGDMESCGRQVLRKMRRLIFVSFLPCALSMQYAAALTFNEPAADESPAAGYRWFTERNSTEASAPSQLQGEKKLVWSFRAGNMLVMGMSNRSNSDKFPHIFFERGRQVFLERGGVPHVAVRIERQF